MPLKLQILHQGQPLRELQANTSAQVWEGLALAAACPSLLLLPTTFCSVSRSQVLLRCCPALQSKRWTGWCWGSCRWPSRGQVDQSYASVDTLLPGRAVMVRQGGAWRCGYAQLRGTNVLTDRPKWMWESSWGFWAWASLLPTCLAPCSPSKRPLWGRYPNPSPDGCCWLSQLHSARKWLPDLSGKGEKAVGGREGSSAGP